MRAGVYNLRVDAGATLAKVLTLWADEAKTEAFDLTSWTPSAVIRTPGGPVVLELDCDVVNPATGGQISLHIAAVDTAALPAPSSALWWELSISAGDLVRRLLEGNVLVTAGG
jgi:hypothetical protein